MVTDGLSNLRAADASLTSAETDVPPRSELTVTTATNARANTARTRPARAAGVGCFGTSIIFFGTSGSSQ